MNPALVRSRIATALTLLWLRSAHAQGSAPATDAPVGQSPSSAPSGVNPAASSAPSASVSAPSPSVSAPSPSSDAPSAPHGTLTKAPRLVQYVEPALPPEGVKEPVSVLLELSIGSDGHVSSVDIVSSSGEPYDTNAREAGMRLVFEPAEIDGVPSAVRIKYRYEFKPATPAVVVALAARFSGVVRDKNTHQGLVGVHVELDSGQTATTDERGHFDFESVEPGAHLVSLSGAMFTPIGTEETLEAGKSYEALYEIEISAVPVPDDERADFEVVVMATKLDSKVTATEISADQGGKVAGTGGDVVKVVENLPGVARSSVGSGQLVVWGASGADTRVYIDNVHVPVLYHEGGFRSVVHSDLVQSVVLEPGGYGAPYGRGLGGLVTVGLKPINQQGTHGSVQVDAIDASAALRTDLGDKWHLQVAGRRSHLDQVLRQVNSKDVADFVPIPKYWDAQARLGWTPKEGISVEAGTLFSSDEIERNLRASDPAETKHESKTTRFNRFYARYRSEQDGNTTTVTPYFGFDETKVVSRFGAVPAQLSNSASVIGFRASHQTRASSWLALNMGVDAEMTSNSLSRAGSVTTPPREGDLRVFGQLPEDLINADTWSVLIAGLAPYGEGDWTPFGDRFHVIPGFRVEPEVVRVSRSTPTEGDIPAVGTARQDTAIDPRLALRWSITDRLSTKAAVGIYHQPPFAEDLSAVFGNPTLGPSRARHYLAGAAYHITEPLSLELTGFYSHSDDLAVRSPLPTPTTAEALVAQGRGRAYGGQGLLRYDSTEGFFGWASASVIRSQRTDPDGTWRLFDFDQTYVLTAVGTFELGAGFEVSGRARYSTGFPRTPVISATYDARTDAFVPVFGKHNSIRIPDFYAFDVRGTKRFRWGDSTELEVYLDVQNVTNHPNQEEIVYNYNYSQKSYITGLPILPVFGARLSW
ncbi:MAG TPA: TonB family protein [Polyangiaceae bacterium]|nr:TonB family protein [Polyangiaceae bacterium]